MIWHMGSRVLNKCCWDIWTVSSDIPRLQLQELDPYLTNNYTSVWRLYSFPQWLHNTRFACMNMSTLCMCAIASHNYTLYCIQLHGQRLSCESVIAMPK